MPGEVWKHLANQGMLCLHLLLKKKKKKMRELIGWARPLLHVTYVTVYKFPV